MPQEKTKTMNATTLSVRMDKSLREEFGSFCKEIGLTPSAAVTLFIRRTLSERAIPFKVAAPDPFYSEENLRVLRRRAAELSAPGKVKIISPDEI